MVIMSVLHVLMDAPTMLRIPCGLVFVVEVSGLVSAHAAEGWSTTRRRCSSMEQLSKEVIET